MRLARWLTGLGMAAGLAAWLPSPASASEGVIEINQAIALAGGVNGDLLADPVGFPVNISQPGSYRLTGDLSVDQNTTAIVIAADDVSIDLGGFAIHGPNTCSGGGAIPVVCTLNGSGRGIVSLSPHSGTSVRNGTVEGMGSTGIDLHTVESRVEGVSAGNNGGMGLLLASGLISQVQAFRNRFDGIWGVGLHVTHSSTSSNGGAGITVNDGSVVSECTSRNNYGGGIVANGYGTVVAGNTVSGSGRNGIYTGGSALVTNNHVDSSGGCGVFNTGAVAGALSSLGGNALLRNNTLNLCASSSGQNEFEGPVLATSCNVITCTTGSVLLGTLCPPNIVQCL